MVRWPRWELPAEAGAPILWAAVALLVWLVLAFALVVALGVWRP